MQHGTCTTCVDCPEIPHSARHMLNVSAKAGHSCVACGKSAAAERVGQQQQQQRQQKAATVSGRACRDYYIRYMYL